MPGPGSDHHVEMEIALEIRKLLSGSTIVASVQCGQLGPVYSHACNVWQCMQIALQRVALPNSTQSTVPAVRPADQRIVVLSESTH